MSTRDTCSQNSMQQQDGLLPPGQVAKASANCSSMLLKHNACELVGHVKPPDRVCSGMSVCAAFYRANRVVGSFGAQRPRLFSFVRQLSAAARSGGQPRRKKQGQKRPRNTKETPAPGTSMSTLRVRANKHSGARCNHRNSRQHPELLRDLLLAVPCVFRSFAVFESRL